MNIIRRKISYVVLLCGFFIYLNAFGKDVTFDIIISNQLNDKIWITPENIQQEYYPALVLKEVSTENFFAELKEKNSLEIPLFKKTSFFVTLNEISSEKVLTKLKTTEESLIIQRLVAKNEKKETIGYISFRCSKYNTNPIITMESEQNYIITEERSSFGGSEIRITIKNA